MIIISQGNCTMIAEPGMVYGVSDEQNRKIAEQQLKEARIAGNVVRYSLLTDNERDGGVQLPQINLKDLDEDEDIDE